MKIKLQDYSFISSEWIDNQFRKYSEFNEKGLTEEQIIFKRASDAGIRVFIKELKQQLIPSEKLASAVYEQCTVIGTALSFKEQEQHKPIYLKSEIEIDE